MITLEDILSKENVGKAFRALKQHSALGVDKMSPEGFKEWCRRNPYQMSQSIMDGTYTPMPVKRVLIPKEDGSMRPIGISCVRDKVTQNAVANKLVEMYDPKFSNASFGFRPNRSAHDAVKLARNYLNSGYEYVIDLDLKSFFDLVNRNVLKNILMEEIKDIRVIRLICRILSVKIVENNTTYKTTTGLVQGGTISPILANIVLDKLDKELEKRGLKFVRFADDCMIFFKSNKAAKRSYETIKKFIEDKLKLQINETKTKVGRFNSTMKFLGFTLYKKPERFNPMNITNSGTWEITVHKKSLAKFRTKVKPILNKKAPRGVDHAKDSYKKFILGWAHYFAIGLNKSNIAPLMQWIRAKIRAIYLKQWKRNATKYNEFTRLKTNSSKQCWIVAHSSLGIWAKAHHSNYIITNKVIHEEWEWPDLETVVRNKSWVVLGY